MKIIQITDLHVTNETGNAFGVDVRQNFLDTLKSVRNIKPEMLVITGDLCFETGNEEVYVWIKSHLDFLKIPYLVIGGNHDLSTELAEVFEIPHLLVGGELYYKREIGGQTVLFLETSSGLMSKEQLAWIEHELGMLEHDTVIFMHHPPLIGGVPHMDNNYALKNMDEVQEVLFNFPHHLSIFCGHYHVEKTLCLRNLTVHITPSTYFQIDSGSEGFKVDHFEIGLRKINIRKDGVVESNVIYQEGNKIE